jgi:hypothetical protein
LQPAKISAFFSGVASEAELIVVKLKKARPYISGEISHPPEQENVYNTPQM